MVGTCDVNNVKYLSPTQGKHFYTPKNFILTPLATEKILSAMIPHFMRVNCLKMVIFTNKSYLIGCWAVKCNGYPFSLHCRYDIIYGLHDS